MVKWVAKTQRPSHFQLSEQQRETAHPRLPFGSFLAIHNELLRNSHGSEACETCFKGEFLLTRLDFHPVGC